MEKRETIEEWKISTTAAESSSCDKAPEALLSNHGASARSQNVLPNQGASARFQNVA